MTSSAQGYSDAQIPDMERRLAGLVRVGTIAELDEANARVKVQAGEITTGWLPWTLGRAGPDSHWSAPEVGEQVILAAPSGDLTQAVVLGSIYQDAHPAPGNSKDRTVTKWADGATQSYDRAAHSYALDVPSGGKIVFRCGASNIEISNAGIKLTGPRIDFNKG